MPPAARITDMHVCPMVNPGPVPHVGGPIAMGSFDVFTGKLPQARVGDMAVCVGPPDTIVKGSSGVFVNKKPAARIGDNTAHGGVIVAGLLTVIIGETKGGGGGGGGVPLGAITMSHAEVVQQIKVLLDAWGAGIPFCEVCFKQAAGKTLDSSDVVSPTALEEIGFHDNFTTAQSTPKTVKNSETGLGWDVDKYLKYTPTLTHQMKQLKGTWTIREPTMSENLARLFDISEQAYTIKDDLLIVVSHDSAAGVLALAHEVGHALYKTAPYDTSSRNEFIKSGTREELKSEGAAVFNAIIIARELERGTGKSYIKESMKEYLAIVDSNADYETKITLLGNLYSTKKPSVGSASNYVEYYELEFGRIWDEGGYH